MTELAQTPTYRVVAEFVNIKIGGLAGVIPGNRSGVMIIGLYRDALVPAGALPAAVERLAAAGMIEPIEAVVAP